MSDGLGFQNRKTEGWLTIEVSLEISSRNLAEPNTSQLGSYWGLEGFHWSGFSSPWGRAQGFPAVSVELLSAPTSTQAENLGRIPDSKRPLKTLLPSLQNKWPH